MKPTCLALALASVWLFAGPARASSMPKADFGGPAVLGVGVGAGTVNLALDAPVAPDWSLGVCVGTRNLVGSVADVRALWRFWTHGRNPFDLALLAGVQADGPGLGKLTGFQPVVGVAGAYPITHQLTLRLNVAVGLSGTETTRPAGVELAYRFAPTIEGTIGANGRGDFLGIKLAL